VLAYLLDQGVVDGKDDLLGQLQDLVQQHQQALAKLLAGKASPAQKGIGGGPVLELMHGR
jgi:hypothetical protein